MKKIALVDVDSKLPNLALMKLSSYYKQSGDDITLVNKNNYPGSLFMPLFDEIYSSKIFTWTNDIDDLPIHAKRGGPAYKEFNKPLMSKINNQCPDYELYGIDYSMGFTTRGCKRSCSWCHVPSMEGSIREEHDVDVFLRHANVVLMDNNALAHPFGLAQMEKLASLNVGVDYNQGLDARLVDNNVAKLLVRLKWTKSIRFACDLDEMFPVVKRAVEKIRNNGGKMVISSYVLAKDIKSSMHRVKLLKEINVLPYVQPYIDRDGDAPSKLLRFYKWYQNTYRISMSISFEKYLEDQKQYELIDELKTELN